jgi:hypothetical protein
MRWSALLYLMVQNSSNLSQQNALTTQGFCHAFGVVLPSPFYLQKILLVAISGGDVETAELREIWTRIVQSVRISKREEEWVEDVCGPFDSWFGNPFLTCWVVVWELIGQRIGLVSSFPLSFSCNHMFLAALGIGRLQP